MELGSPPQLPGELTPHVNRKLHRWVEFGQGCQLLIQQLILLLVNIDLQGLSQGSGHVPSQCRDQQLVGVVSPQPTSECVPEEMEGEAFGQIQD